MSKSGGMKKLAVKTDSGWQWVFCRFDGRVLTTTDKQKALPWDAYEWFQSKFANREFQVMKSLPDQTKGANHENH